MKWKREQKGKKRASKEKEKNKRNGEINIKKYV